MDMAIAQERPSERLWKHISMRIISSSDRWLVQFAIS